MLRIFIVFTTLIYYPVANASNYNFLEDLPIAHFSKEDTKLFEDSIQSALNTKKDGDNLAWKNDKTGTSGLLIPLSSYQEDGKECRNLRIVNRANNVIAESIFKFCKHGETWVPIKLLK